MDSERLNKIVFIFIIVIVTAVTAWAVAVQIVEAPPDSSAAIVEIEALTKDAKVDAKTDPVIEQKVKKGGLSLHPAKFFKEAE